MKHIVCLSGGHSSGHVAIEVAAKFGKENVILLNHNINKNVESSDIKRFKMEISNFVGIPITYANIDGILDDEYIPDQFDVINEIGALTSPNHNALCTAKLKTEPFYEYLSKFAQRNLDVIYYGFDATEPERIKRRVNELGARGYFTDFPLANWGGVLMYKDTESIGIVRPNTYNVFKHANCIGCLKAGQLHWYVVFCTDKKTWAKAKKMEETVNFSILRRMVNGIRSPLFLKDLESSFCKLQSIGVPANEHIGEQKFADRLRKIEAPISENMLFPCACTF